MKDLSRNGFNIIGGVIFLFLGFFYMIVRLLKVWGLSWLIGGITGWNLGGLSSFLRIFIYLIAAVYLVIAILGFAAGGSDKKSLRRVVFYIGIVFSIIGLITVFKYGGLMPWLKIIAGVCYILFGNFSD
ncbi:MAG: hypothetical protein Q4P08_04790 [Eubacteriales bacterium]|nr:hypothetical protein [Eubacteriales bacterium]